MVIEVTDANYETVVLKSEKPVMVFACAKWLNPCAMTAPEVEATAVDYEGRVVVGRVDIDACPEAVKNLGIRGIPNFLFFKKGILVSAFQSNCANRHMMGGHIERML
ncbi:MAG: thioredoxin [bacterium]|nr:thioredoxin [bacterium]